MRNPDESYFKPEVTQKQPLIEESNTATLGSLVEFPRKKKRVQLLTLRAVMRRYRLSQRVVYQELTPYGRGDNGRDYYSESEAQALLNRNCEWAYAA